MNLKLKGRTKAVGLCYMQLSRPILLCSVFLFVMVLLAISTSELIAQETSHSDNVEEWTWRLGTDPDTVRRSRAEFDSILRLHGTWLESRKKMGERLNLDHSHLRGADLDSLDLRQATFHKADLTGASFRYAVLHSVHFVDALLDSSDLSNAELAGAYLGGAHLSNAKLRGVTAGGAELIYSLLNSADLAGATLQHANLSGAHVHRANLEGAILAGANLEGAEVTATNLAGADLSTAELLGTSFDSTDLRDVNLSGAVLTYASFTHANLQGVLFEVESLPDVPSLATSQGLQTLRWEISPVSIVELRDKFYELGLKQQEREIICALNRHNDNWIAYLLFDLTSEYGSNLSRPWLLFLMTWLICALFYYVRLMRKGCKDLRVSLSRVTNQREDAPLFAAASRDIVHLIMNISPYSKEFLSIFGEYGTVPTWLRMMWWALFFSSVSAFNIGFRDVNFGRWLRHLTRKEFDLSAVGSMRVVSGVQALISVYLIGLWILSFTSTPFK